MQTVVLAILMALCSSGCDGGSEDSAAAGMTESEPCRIVEAGRSLPAEVRETSGLALSTQSADVLWTHNDRGNEPVLFAIAADGALLNRVAITDAALVDWEDVQAGPCAAGSCLYIADIGDNSASREHITIYEVAEPALDADSSQPVRPLHARYPDGAHNAEALFILPSGDLFIVTKGDDGPVTLYRYAASARGDSIVTLERVRAVMPQPPGRAGRVTGAAASPDGRWVVVRTYSALHFFPATEFVGGAATAPLTMDLRALDEPQGEGVAMGTGGTVWLSSEAENDSDTPRRARLTCTLPE